MAAVHLGFQVLFVAGPLDGEWRTVSRLSEWFAVDQWENWPRTGQIEIVRYRLLPFRGERQCRHVYVFQDLDIDAAIDLILSNYRSPTLIEAKLLGHDRIEHLRLPSPQAKEGKLHSIIAALKSKLGQVQTGPESGDEPIIVNG